MTLNHVSIAIYANRNHLSYKKIAETAINKILKKIIVLSVKNYDSLGANSYKASKGFIKCI